jgi:hypothetical protein
MVAAAVTTRNPQFAEWSIPAGALAGTLSEEAFNTARRAWATEGIGLFAEAIEDEAGISVEDWLTTATPDRKTRLLLGEAVDMASMTADEWRIRTLARAFVVGAGDGSKVDPMRMLVRYVADLDAVDVRMLRALSPEARTVEFLCAVDSQLRPVAEILLRRLLTVEFAERDAVAEQREAASRRDTVSESAAEMSRSYDVVPLWRVTPLGRTVGSLLAEVETQDLSHVDLGLSAHRTRTDPTVVQPEG